jgi:hypothetical protein
VSISTLGNGAGRFGAKDAELFLGSPATVAASADGCIWTRAPLPRFMNCIDRGATRMTEFGYAQGRCYKLERRAASGRRNT